MDVVKIILCAQHCALRRFEYSDPERLRSYLDSKWECPLDIDVQELHEVLGRTEDIREWLLFQDAYLMTVSRLLYAPSAPKWEFPSTQSSSCIEPDLAARMMAVSRFFNLVALACWPLVLLFDLLYSLFGSATIGPSGRSRSSIGGSA